MVEKHSSHWKAKANHLVLLALKDGAKHGYEITKYIDAASKGYFSIGYSSLYPTLHSLEKEGLIEGEWQAVGAKEKKVYKLTRKGLQNIRTMENEYSSFIAAFGSLLKGVQHV